MTWAPFFFNQTRYTYVLRKEGRVKILEGKLLLKIRGTTRLAIQFKMCPDGSSSTEIFTTFFNEFEALWVSSFDVELWNRLFQLNLPVQKGKERYEENKFYIIALDMSITSWIFRKLKSFKGAFLNTKYIFKCISGHRKTHIYFSKLTSLFRHLYLHT